MEHVTSALFTTRIPRLLLGTSALPRRSLDFAILLVSSLTGLAPDREHDEGEVNAHLRAWLLLVGPSLPLDHSAVRRYLVDLGFLARDAAGRAYSVRTEGRQFSFDRQILGLDLSRILAAARQARLERKRHHLGLSPDA